MKSKRYRDPVVEAYKRDVDRTLLRENLNLTFEQRMWKFARAMKIIEKLRKNKKHSRFFVTMKTTDEVFKFAAKHGIADAGATGVEPCAKA